MSGLISTSLTPPLLSSDPEFSQQGHTDNKGRKGAFSVNTVHIAMAIVQARTVLSREAVGSFQNTPDVTGGYSNTLSCCAWCWNANQPSPWSGSLNPTTSFLLVAQTHCSLGNKDGNKQQSSARQGSWSHRNFSLELCMPALASLQTQATDWLFTTCTHL